MRKHTPEPWRWLDFEGAEDQVIYGQDTMQRPIGAFYVWPDAEYDPRANAHRAIACVNACAGMSDPEATIAAYRAVADMHEIADAENEYLIRECDALRAERDGLLAQLQTISLQATKTEWEDGVFSAELAWQHIEEANALIARSTQK